MILDDIEGEVCIRGYSESHYLTGPASPQLILQSQVGWALSNSYGMWLGHFAPELGRHWRPRTPTDRVVRHDCWMHKRL